MKTKIQRGMLLGLACALATTGLLRAGDEMPAEVAKTAAVRRYVAADADARETRVLEVKAPIYVDETVKTAPRARAQIRFADGSIVGLGSDSELVVSKYVYDAKAQKGELKVKVKKGFFRVLGGAISKKDPIVVETPVATCGIRGSLAFGYFDEVREVLYVMVLKGELTVDANGKVETVKTAGHGTVVGKGQAPQPGREFDISEVNTAADSEPNDVSTGSDPETGGEDSQGIGTPSSSSSSSSSSHSHYH